MKSWPALIGSGNPEAHDYAAHWRELEKQRMMSMVEKVARAMWEKRREIIGKMPAGNGLFIKLDPWGSGIVPAKNGIFEEARAAIEAMREPTEAMRHAPIGRGGTVDGFLDMYDETQVWQAMIDVALNEK